MYIILTERSITYRTVGISFQQNSVYDPQANKFHPQQRWSINRKGQSPQNTPRVHTDERTDTNLQRWQTAADVSDLLNCTFQFHGKCRTKKSYDELNSIYEMQLIIYFSNIGIDVVIYMYLFTSSFCISHFFLIVGCKQQFRDSRPHYEPNHWKYPNIQSICHAYTNAYDLQVFDFLAIDRIYSIAFRQIIMAGPKLFMCRLLYITT